MTDNEQRAHDIALLFMQRNLTNFSGKETNEELSAILENARNKQAGKNLKTSTVLDDYEHLYKSITTLLQ